jgi:hypothetical protein
MRKIIFGYFLLCNLIIFSQEKVTTQLNQYLTDEGYPGDKVYKGGGETVSIEKSISKGDISEYVYLSVKHDGSSTNKKLYGVYVLFENGKSIVRSKQEIMSYYTEEIGHQYKVILDLNINDIYLFKTQKVTSVKLNKYTSNVSENESNAILKAAKVILTSQKK